MFVRWSKTSRANEVETHPRVGSPFAVARDNITGEWRMFVDTDDRNIGHYESEKAAVAAARRLSGMGHIHLQPCEKFESPYAENGPGVWHTSHLECIVCYWQGHAHSNPPEQPEAA
jgi:hypothetical protein